jgi:hypothetical protein
VPADVDNAVDQLTDAQVVVIEAERIALGDVVYMSFCGSCRG